MVLSIDTIKKITVGAVDIKCLEDGIHFYKCTERQINAWKAIGDNVYGGSLASTGVRFDFTTNSKSFRVKTTPLGKFELFVDNILIKRFIQSKNPGDIFIDLTEDAPYISKADCHRITLYLPSHTPGIIKSVEIDDGAWVKPCEYKTKMLFIGDSITQGWDSKYDTNAYAIKTSRFFDANSVINGIGGAFYHTTTFDSIPFDPDIVILAYGTNDAFIFSFDDMKKQVSGYLDLIKAEYGDKKVFVISPIWRGNNEGENMNADFVAKRAMVEEEGAKHGFTVIKGLELVPPIDDFYADRFLHPNDLGFASYTENLCKKILEAL